MKVKPVSESSKLMENRGERNVSNIPTVTQNGDIYLSMTPN